MAKWLKTFAKGVASLSVLLSHGALASTPKADVPKIPQIDSIEQPVDELAMLVMKAPVEAPRVLVASRFKEPGDKGRPDIFGAPGKPVIGPPGKSGY
jgi:hypothetical protein